jgi:predicted ester cyclase
MICSRVGVRTAVSQSALFTQPDRTAPTSRRAVYCAIVLALLTGLVAGQLAAPSHHDFGSPALAPSAKAALLAADYYGAVNRYLQGDHPDRLETLIRPDYIGHPVENAAGENRDELLARLDGVKRMFPSLQLNAEVLSADSRLVVVRVTINGTSGGVLAGISIETTAAPAEIEVLRFDEDTLAERWSHAQWPATFDLHGTVLHTTAPASPLQPRLEHITLEPHGQMELAFGTAFLIETETGALEVQRQEDASTPAAEQRAASTVPLVGAEPVTLRVGELAIAALGGPYTIRARGDGAATFLLLRIENFLRESDLSSMAFQGLSPTSPMPDHLALAHAVVVESDEQPWVISIGRVTLASETVLASHPIEGAEIVVVESGMLQISTRDCTTRCIETHAGTSEFVSGKTALQETDGFSAAQGASVSYGAGPAGEATFLLITIARPRSEHAYS